MPATHLATQPLNMALLDVKTQAFNAWSPGQTWYAWCSTTSTTMTMGDQAWIAWNSSVSTTTGSLAYNYTTNTPYTYAGQAWVAWNAQHEEETQEQQAAREAAQAEATASWEARRATQAAAEIERLKVQAAADQRALELLLSLLSGEQRQSYLDKGWFEVRGSKGGRWRIRNKGQSGNVDLMPEIGEERDMSFCAHPEGRLPNADAHLAQMLALVTDEGRFVRTANVHYRRPGFKDELAPYLRVVA